MIREMIEFHAIHVSKCEATNNNSPNAPASRLTAVELLYPYLTRRDPVPAR
jgi:hypothetical protein